MDINPAAADILEVTVKKYVGKSLPELVKEKPAIAKPISEVLGSRYDQEQEFTVTNSETGNTINVLISRIQDQHNTKAGWLIQFSDISEQKQIEANLETIQADYESVMDTLHDNYFEADPTGVITNVNAAFLTNFVVSEQDVVGKHFRHFVHRKSIRDIFKGYQQIYETKQAQKVSEYSFIRKDGEEIIGEITVSPIIEDNEVVGTRGLIRDVTARVEAEREVSRQKDLLDGLLQQSPIAMVINDIDSRISAVNPAFEKLFGYSREEALGKDLDDILSTPEIVKEMKEVTALGMSEQASIVGKRKRKDGSLVDVELFVTPLFVRGKRFGYLAFYNDITERLKVESNLEKTQSTFYTTLDTLGDPYFEAEPSGTITYANQAFCRAIEYPNKEQVIGKHFRYFTSRKFIREVYKRFGELYETKKAIKPFHYQYRQQSGHEQISEMAVSPIIDDDGEVIGTRGIIRDISERIKAENILKEAKEAAEARAGELSTINRISETVSQSLDLETILQSICVELTKIFDIRNAGIGLLTPEGDSLEIVAFHAIDSDETSALGLILPFEGNQSSQEVIENKTTVVIQDAQSDPRTSSVADISRTRGTKAIMIVPLLARGNAIGTIGMPAKDPEHVFTKNEIELAETIASQIAAAIDNAQLHGKTETALDVAERDLEIGRQIQSGFFPENLPEIPGWDIATHFHAARQVAGDFYDAFQFKKSKFTAFIIADVCDKGVGAALFMVLFRSLLRAFSEIKITSSNVQKQLLTIILNTNNFIAEFHGRSNMFATLFFGVLDPGSNILYYVNGGHEPPVILGKDGAITQRLSPTGPAVGMFPDMEFKVEQIQFKEGDSLVGFTDGTTDAKNNSGEQFTEERLLDFIVCK